MPDRLAIGGDGRPTLVGRRCAACGTVIHGTAEGCPRCTAQELEPVSLAGTGEVASFTEVHRASRDWAGPVPYALAEVRLEEGPVVVARLLDWPDGLEPEIGQRVRVDADPVGPADSGEDGSPNGGEELVVYGWRRDA
jgi:uncharacterized OB-fold protein